jgi:hypothetical protein
MSILNGYGGKADKFDNKLKYIALVFKKRDEIILTNF